MSRNIQKYSYNEILSENDILMLSYTDVVDEAPLLMDNVKPNPRYMLEVLDVLFTVCKYRDGYKQANLNDYESLSTTINYYGLDTVRKRFQLHYPEYKLFISKKHKTINVQIAKKITQ